MRTVNFTVKLPVSGGGVWLTVFACRIAEGKIKKGLTLYKKILAGLVLSAAFVGSSVAEKITNIEDGPIGNQIT